MSLWWKCVSSVVLSCCKKLVFTTNSNSTAERTTNLQKMLVGRQWQTGSEFSTGHGWLKGTLLFTNTEGFKFISAKGALFQQKGGPFATGWILPSDIAHGKSSDRVWNGKTEFQLLSPELVNVCECLQLPKYRYVWNGGHWGHVPSRFCNKQRNALFIFRNCTMPFKWNFII